jgi:hypothetical protein
MSVFRSMFGLPPKKESIAPVAPVDRFTLQHLHSLHGSLVRLKSAPPTSTNDDQVIDVVKQISELMVFGDKHDEKYFE